MRHGAAVLRGEEMVGFDKTITLYRRDKGWTATVLRGVSLRFTAAHKSVERSQRAYSQAGLEPQRELKVLLPAAILDEDFSVQAGDVLLIGEGEKQLTSPSELFRQGREAAVLCSVCDRREQRLPYVLLEGR